jgi:hypothetical protein
MNRTLRRCGKGAVGIEVLRDGDRVLVRADPRATDGAWSPLKIFKVRSA